MCQLTNMSMHRLINVPIAQCSDCPICRLAVYTHRSIYILNNLVNRFPFILGSRRLSTIDIDEFIFLYLRKDDRQ